MRISAPLGRPGAVIAFGIAALEVVISVLQNAWWSRVVMPVS